MTKFIITEEEKNRIMGLYEQPIQPPGTTLKKFEAEAYVYNDAITTFIVSKFVTSGSNVKMFLDNNTRYSINFMGPIYDTKTNKQLQLYPRADFINIDETNYKQIAKTYGIPLL